MTVMFIDDYCNSLAGCCCGT